MDKIIDEKFSACKHLPKMEIRKDLLTFNKEVVDKLAVIMTRKYISQEEAKEMVPDDITDQ